MVSFTTASKPAALAQAMLLFKMLIQEVLWALGNVGKMVFGEGER
jgi:hypothetical protein